MFQVISTKVVLRSNFSITLRKLMTFPNLINKKKKILKF